MDLAELSYVSELLIQMRLITSRRRVGAISAGVSDLAGVAARNRLASQTG